MEAEPARQELACDCGYVAHGADDEELVAAVQAHAIDVHGMALPAELVLNLIGSNSACVPAAPGSEPGAIPVRVRTRQVRR